MIINGLEKLSLVDFDGHLCCTTFSGGCNFRCPFCHNAPLVIQGKKQPIIEEGEFFDYLKKRVKILDSVCISGGEATLQRDLIDFIVKIKELNYLVKIDTNGTNPKLLEKLIDEMLVDYIAMDIKNSKDSYAKTVGLDIIDINSINQSVELLLSQKIQYELRTTLVADFHTRADIEEMGVWLSGAEKMFLQKFKDTGNCIKDNLFAVPVEVAEEYKDILSKSIKNVSLRGYDD